MNDIMKIIQALEDSNILLKGVTKTINNETKKQKGEFLNMLSGTLGAGLLGNMLVRKGIVASMNQDLMVFILEYVPEEIKKFIENKNIKANIF